MANCDTDIPQSLRRLRQIASSIVRINVNSPDLAERIEALKSSAEAALKGLSFARGGSPALAIARKRAREARRRIAAETDKRVLPIIREVKKANPNATIAQIAAELDKRGIAPPSKRSKRWSISTVRVILDRSNKR